MTSILFLILYYIYRVNNISCEINILVSLNIYLYNFGLNENLNQDSLNGARFTSISFKAFTDTILTVTDTTVGTFSIFSSSATCTVTSGNGFNISTYNTFSCRCSSCLI